MQQGCKIIKSKKIYVNKNNELVIEINPIELNNNEIFELIVCNNIPENANENHVIKILNNNTVISLYNMTGNYTRADQIKTRMKYPLIYGVDPIHVSFIRRINPSKFSYNTNKEI